MRTHCRKHFRGDLKNRFGCTVTHIQIQVGEGVGERGQRDLINLEIHQIHEMILAAESCRSTGRSVGQGVRSDLTERVCDCVADSFIRISEKVGKRRSEEGSLLREIAQRFCRAAA